MNDDTKETPASHVRAALRSVGREWIKVTTGTILAIAVSAVSYLPLGNSHPWIPFIAFVLIWSVAWIWAFVRSWTREHDRGEAYKQESDEIYADVILDYLKSTIKTRGCCSTTSLAKDLSLPEDAVRRGLIRLKQLGLVEETPLGWNFSGADAILVDAQYKKLPIAKRSSA
jgi:hypothetical protein